jgi:hypothetical protein
MTKLAKLYEKALRSPNNMLFHDLCSLAEAVGFVYQRNNGSHMIYKHLKITGPDGFINIQDYKGKAKPYQVRQITDIIQKYNLNGKG